ncbi:MAG: ATP-binding cassette domain-containing protein, partial [Fimbriimonadaceae bacterium]
MPFLELRGIEKRFGATVALGGVDFSLERGEVHALVGENGSGKSTLMRVLAGVHPLDAGSMSLDGAPFLPRSPRDARERGVAMIHQELSLCPDLS